MNKIKWCVLVLAIPLSGCFYQSVNNVDIRKAITYCGTLENVAAIRSTFVGDEIAHCDNKKSEFLNGVYVENK